MQVALRTLRQFWAKHPPAEVPLRTWYTIVSHAHWAVPADVKKPFGAAVDFVSDNRAIFDIGGNKDRLIVHIAYPFRRMPADVLIQPYRPDRHSTGRPAA